MRFRKRLSYENGLKAVHAAPFITVAFLLIMFLLFSSGFGGLPGARIGLLAAAPFAGQTVRIIVSHGGAVINGAVVTDVQLSSFLGSVAFRDPAVLIMAEKTTPIESAMRIWRICNGAGIRRVSLMTD